MGHATEPRASNDVARSFDAFKESHDALVKYLGYRYPKGSSGAEVTEAEFLAKVKADATLKSGKLSLYDQGKSAWAEKDISAASDDELKASYAQIESDKKTMRYGMVIGSLSISGDKPDESATNFRDPCKGFLMLKKEVVVALKKTGLRWGGQDFGDMMHFDMGVETLNDFLDIPVSTGAAAVVNELSSDSDAALQKLKDAATAVKSATETAGPAANTASLADNTAKEDSCWAVVASAKSVLGKINATKAAAKKAAKGSDEKKQKALDDADKVLTEAKKVEDDAKKAAAM